MGAAGLPAAVTLAAVMAMATAPPGSCPAVNKRGFRPGAVVAYMTAPSSGGTPFPAALVPCVRRAFDAWTRANARTGLGVAFAWGPGGIVVRMDDPGGRLLTEETGGAWSGPGRDADGYLERADIWLTSDPGLVDRCEGVTKVVLHELGHLHGLADRPVPLGRSVMNRAVRRNDSGERIPLGPTPCDAARALAAASYAASHEPLSSPARSPWWLLPPALPSPSTASDRARPPPPRE